MDGGGCGRTECGRYDVGAALRRAGAVYDAGAGDVLRRDDPCKEHPRHVDDELCSDGHRDDPVGRRRRLAGVLGQQRIGIDRWLRPRRTPEPGDRERDIQLLDPGLRLPDVPADVRHHHAGGRHGGRGRADEVHRLDRVPHPLVASRVHPAHSLDLGRRLPRDRCEGGGLRGGGAGCGNQLRGLGPGARARAGAARRLETSDHPATQPASHNPGRRDPVVRLVWFQRRLFARGERPRGAGVHGDAGRGDGVDHRGVILRRENRPPSGSPPGQWRGWWPSPQRQDS